MKKFTRAFRLVVMVLAVCYFPHVLSAQCDGGETLNTYCYANGETNNVAFEICPSAGQAVEARIIGGSFFIPLNSLTVYSGTQGSGTAGTIQFGPTNMMGAIPNVTITSLGADQCLIFITNTNPASVACVQGFGDPIEVCSRDIAATTVGLNIDPDEFCATDGVQTLGGGFPAGGMYSGTGVSDNSDGTFDFDPSGLGGQTITVTYTNGGTATDEISVLATGGVSFTALDDVCLDEGLQTNLSGGSPAGGTYSGPGVMDNGNGTYSFNPGVAGLGVQTISYTEPDGCMETITDDVEVLAACGCPQGQTSFFYCYDNNETDVVAFEVCPNGGEFAKATINGGSYASGDQLTVYEGAPSSGTAGTLLNTLTGEVSGNEFAAATADNCIIFVSTSNVVLSCQDGFADGLSVCGESLPSSGTVTFTAPDDLSVNAGVQMGLSGGLPTGGVYIGDGVTDGMDGVTYSFDPAIAGVGTTTITYEVSGVGSASDEVEVLNLLPPTFSKSFAPSTVGLSNVSLLTLTIDNTGSATPAEDLAFVDNLPAGIQIASVPDAQTTCNAGTLTAPAGGSTISYTGGEIAGSSSCTISVYVVGTALGLQTNITGDLTSSSGNSGIAQASLNVVDNDVALSMAFSPSTVNVGERSRITYTFDNSQGTNFRGISMSNLFPDGLVIATPANGDAGCTQIFTPVPGATSVFASNLFINAGEICVVEIDVVATAPGEYVNVLSQPTGTGARGLAVAKLTVNPQAALNIQTAFNPISANIGETAMLEVTIDNNDRSFDATNVEFNIDLDAALTGLAVVGAPLNNVCGTGSQITGTSTLALSGGTISAGGNCTFTVPVMVPNSATAQEVTTTTSAITATVDGNTVTGNTSTATLFIGNFPTVTKTFLTDPIVAGGTTQLEITITNNSATSDLTAVSFSDDLDDLLSGVRVTGGTGNNICGNGSSLFYSCGNPNCDNIVTFFNGSIPASGSCSFTIDIQVPAGAVGGTYTNELGIVAGTVDGSDFEIEGPTDDLTVLAAPELTKSFIDDPVNAGETATLEFTITYSDEATVDATNINFTDDLNAALAGLSYSGPTLADICGTGSQLSGTTNLSFTGGTLSPGGSCTFSIQVEVPASAVPGSYPSTTSALSSTVDGQTVMGQAASDDLDVGGLDFTKEFIDDPALPGGLATLRYTIENNTAFDATTISFSEPISNTLSGLTFLGPDQSDVCGAGSFLSILSNNTFLFITNGNLTAGSSCSFDVQVRVPMGAANGAYTSTTSNLVGMINGSTFVADPASDPLLVDDTRLELTKSFTDDPAAPGGTVTLEYTITNLDAANSIDNIAFSDNLSDVIDGLTRPGATLTSFCGGSSSLTGYSMVNVSGASLAAGGSCTFSITLDVPANAARGSVNPSTSSEITGEISGIAVRGEPASDDLFIQALELTKAFSGSATAGGTATLTFTLTNESSETISDIEFTDDLDAFISGATIMTLPSDVSTCGAASGISGTSELSFGRGQLRAGESCTFDIEVMIPCGTMPDDYVNTTSTVSFDGASGFAPAATATLTVGATPATGSFTATTSSVCFNDAILTNQSGGLPLGGTYSGPGVTDTGNDTYSFNPSAAGAGIKTITYSVLDDNGCNTVEYMDNITVNPPPAVNFTAPADLCLNDDPVLGLGGGTPTGGTYSGPGVTDGMDGMTFDFDPDEAGVGTHIITYEFTDGNGCTATAMDDIEVFALPIVTFTAPNDICIDQGIQSGLSGGMPVGGTYSGPGVTDNNGTYSFDPSVAGAGVRTIEYEFTDFNGCTVVASDNIEVLEGADLSVTKTDGVTSVAPGGTITYTIVVSNAGPCTDPSVILSDIFPGVLTATYTSTASGGATGNTASGAGDLAETLSMPAGSSVTYTVTATVDCGTTGTLSNTATATASVSDPDTNNNSATDDDTQLTSLPVVSFTAPDDLCENIGLQVGLSGGMPSGGTYSGPGVANNIDGTFNFNPAVAGVGTSTITYGIMTAEGCMVSASDDIEVFAPPVVSFVAPDDFCINEGPISLTGGMPAGGTYAELGGSPDVVDNGNGTFSFNPSTTGVYIIVYTFTDGNGCTESATDEIEVLDAPEEPMIATAIKAFCKGDVTSPSLASTGINVSNSLTGDERVVWVLTGAPMGSAYMVGQEFTTDNCGDPFKNFGELAVANSSKVIRVQDVANAPVGTYTFEAFIENCVSACTSESTGGFSITVNETPAVPTVDRLTRASCVGSTSTVSVVEPSPGLTISWEVVAAPAGASFMAGDILAAGEDGLDYRTDLDASGRRLRIKGNMSVVAGTYQFQAKAVNPVTDCESALTTEVFEINIFEQPTVEISVDPDGDLCLGQLDVMYDATITSTDGGTYTYDWCAYNSGDGSGTCFGGFDDNTIQMPKRSWTSSAGPKSVGVTVMSDVQGCMATALYSFEVIAPTVLECPANQTVTLVTDPTNFDCLAEATFTNPAITPGPCDPVTLTISVDGGAPEIVVADESYTAMFQELGVFTVTYNSVDAVGNTSTCSFDISVDGLPCGLADSGGLGCSSGPADFDQTTETFTLEAGDCAPNTALYTEDQLSFFYTELCGDGEVSAQVTNIGGTGFAGTMLRESDAANSKKMALGTNTVDRLRKEVRVIDGYPSSAAEILSLNQFWIRVRRSGNTFSAFASADGIFWQPYLSQVIFMEDCILAGIYTYGEKAGSGVTATFENVTITGLASLGAPIAIGVQGFSEGLSEEKINIYPNPTNGELNLDLSSFLGEAVDIRLFNSLGQLVYREQVEEVKIAVERLDMHRLPAGVYHVAVQVGQRVLTERVVVE